MSRTIKFVLLFLALAMPGLIYVFLKTFGRNEFTVSPLYQEGPGPIAGDCPGFAYSVPYIVPDSLLKQMTWKSAKATIVFVDQVGTEQAMTRIAGLFPEGAMDVILVPDSVRTTAVCALALQAPANAAIVDSDRRIRGHYNVTDRKETDRLILELTIILKLNYLKEAVSGDD